MGFFTVAWRDEVYRSIDIEAKTKEEAFKKWVEGDWKAKDMEENDCQGLSDTDEVMREIEEIE